MKVCIIVDNPIRDLDGACLISLFLIKQNIEVYLVPMYEWHEVFFINPNFVLINYARSTNIDKINICNELKIPYGILDTEGGILKDVDSWFSDSLKYSNTAQIYFSWGEKQFESIQSKNILNPNKVVTTGCPRYDYAASPWREVLPSIANSKKDMILINTNYPFNNPKYNTPEKELSDSIDRQIYDKIYANELFDQSVQSQNNFINLIKKVSIKFKRLNFVLRPHPFEDPFIYEDRLSRLNNITIQQKYSVFAWISHCKLLLHQNCSTAIEAIILGVQPLNLKWISGPLLTQPTSESASINIDSYDQLCENLSLIENGNEITTSKSKEHRRKKLIKDWFFCIDGNSSKRVSDHISKFINRNSNTKINTKPFQILKTILAFKSYKLFVYALIFYIFGSKFLRKLKSLHKKDVHNHKNFTVKEVYRNMLNLIKADSSLFHLIVQNAYREKFSSIVIKK